MSSASRFVLALALFAAGCGSHQQPRECVDYEDHLSSDCVGGPSDEEVAEIINRAYCGDCLCEPLDAFPDECPCDWPSSDPRRTQLDDPLCGLDVE